MSLFPAYAEGDAGACGELQPIPEMSPACEERLLASDDESPPRKAPRSPPPPPSPPALRDTFYLDPKSDYGNLRVSTLYYPGRPQYASRSASAALGSGGAGERRVRRRRRYFERGLEPQPQPLDEELAARVAAFRAMLADAPKDVDLWLRFIRFQEQCSGDSAALEAAAEASAAAEHAALRRALHRLRRDLLPAHTYLADLRDDIAREKRPERRTELWVVLVRALAGSPAACSASALAAAAAAAAHDTAALPHAYPHVLHAYGSFLRAAGLWELLVLLTELVTSMSFPPGAAFPPPPDPSRDAAADERLLRFEDEVCASGLPLSTRWVRVERARAAAHWRAPLNASAQDLQADPQRAPLAADVTDLLLPVSGPDAAFLLVAQLLRLAKIPMLPGGSFVRRAFSCGAAEARDDCAETLLALTRAARRLPPAHPARPAPPASARLLDSLLDPPHYTHRDTGFLSWVNALWSACCSWMTGDRRVALLCWQLRWMHALALQLDLQEEHGREEMRRMRREARAALRSHAAGAALPFAHFARLEAAAAPAAAAAAARHAARAALADSDLPLLHRLHVARVAAEMPPEHGPGLWPVACAVLGRPLPPDAELSAPPPPDLVERALAVAEQRCADLELRYDTAGKRDEEVAGGALVLAALLPGDGEWAAARALLAAPARRRALLQRCLAAPPPTAQSFEAARYWEQAACALLFAPEQPGRAAAARRLAAVYPDNALLALASGGGGLGAHAALRRTEPGALAELLPPMLRAARHTDEDESPAAAVARRVSARTARRVARAGGGAVAWAALLQAAPQPPLAHLAPALDAHPDHKWLAVRGAAWGGAADALLERQLRLHTLPDELDAARA